MPNPIQDRVRYEITHGGNLELEFDIALNELAPGSQRVYLHETATGVRVDRVAPGEAADVLWLPWRQGTLTQLQPFSISKMGPGTLFFTYYLSGCKVFGIEGGPVWHIDAPIEVNEFWPEIQNDEWVEENWTAGTPRNVAYIHRAGQAANLWDLAGHLVGAAPTTYGVNNVGQALVAGVVSATGNLDLYFKASPWQALKYTAQKLKK